MKFKRGLSGIVTIVILVALVLIAIGIVWMVISGLTRDASREAHPGGVETELRIANATKNNTHIVVKVYSEIDHKDFNGFKFVFYRTNQSIITREIPVESLDELETEKYVFEFDDTSDLERVAIVPFFESQSTTVYGLVEHERKIGEGEILLNLPIIFYVNETGGELIQTYLGTILPPNPGGGDSVRQASAIERDMVSRDNEEMFEGYPYAGRPAHKMTFDLSDHTDMINKIILNIKGYCILYMWVIC